MKPVVVLASCPDYEDANLEAALRAALEPLGGWRNFLPATGTVLLKPNFLAPLAAERAVTTHPRFIAAVARAVREVFPGRILIGDSPAVGSAALAARRLGLPPLIEPYGAEIIEFTETVPVHGAAHFGPLEIAKALIEADAVINLAKVKTHGQMYFTCGVKNLFGGYVGFAKPRLHLTAGRDLRQFARLLLETARRVHPVLTLADGVIGMEGNGPNSGEPRLLGLIAASRDPVALDRVLAEILCFAPAAVPVLAEAAAQNLPGADLDGLEVRGARLEQFRVADWKPARQAAAGNAYLPSFVAHPFRHALTSRPSFDHEKCNRCGLCIKHCAAQALSLKPRRQQRPGPESYGEYLALDLDACIRCYCCQEICPAGAITVGAGFLLNLARRLGIS